MKRSWATALFGSTRIRAISRPAFHLPQSFPVYALRPYPVRWRLLQCHCAPVWGCPAAGHHSASHGGDHSPTHHFRQRVRHVRGRRLRCQAEQALRVLNAKRRSITRRSRASPAARSTGTRASPGRSISRATTTAASVPQYHHRTAEEATGHGPCHARTTQQLRNRASTSVASRGSLSLSKETVRQKLPQMERTSSLMNRMALREWAPQ